uniref:Peptidase M24 domain-containing protein n=1 Tax=Panagrolaimus sp. JU765 TaxID=591449 RepID=A0AC34Q9W8_9BILA
MPEEKQPGVTTVLTEPVVNKYVAAGKVTNDVLKEVIAKAVEGAVVGDLCTYGDERIKALVGNLFKKEKEIERGSCMPTCISINNVVCHFSPLKSENPVVLKNGDVVKIDLGAHIDGYMATAAHTIVVGATKDNKVTGKKADVVLATHYALEAAIRSLHPSKNLQTTDVTNAISKVAEQYKVVPLENMLSHQVDKYEHSGLKEIIQNPTDEQLAKHEKKNFEENEVYVIDIFMSTGEGKGKNSESRTTVYRKNDIIYQLKMKHARQFISEVTKEYANMPFSIRNFANEAQTKYGVVECERHALIQPYPVIIEKDSEFVAHFKYTVLLTSNGITKVAGLTFDDTVYQSEYKIQDPELRALINDSLKKKAAKKEDEKKESGDAKKDEAKDGKKEETKK